MRPNGVKCLLSLCQRPAADSANEGTITDRQLATRPLLRADQGPNLYSTPSGLQEPQHEQQDRRTVFGGSLAHTHSLGAAWLGTEVAYGLQLRQDRLGGSAASLGGPFNASNGGSVSATQLSPRLAIASGPFGGTEFHANAGTCFHSNDLRGATSRVNPADGSALDKLHLLARATSAEIGLRTSPLPGWNLALSLWRTDLSSELVFIGDQGVTEPQGASRRSALEWWNDGELARGLTLDADLAVSHARFVQPSNGGTQVPNAIPVAASLGLSADAGGAWFAGLRVRTIGAHPLEESGAQQSTPFATANLKVGSEAARNSI